MQNFHSQKSWEMYFKMKCHLHQSVIHIVQASLCLSSVRYMYISKTFGFCTLLGHVTLVNVTVTTFPVSYLKSSHCNSFEDWGPVDEIYRCPIFIWVAVIYQRMRGCQDSGTSNSHQRWHALLLAAMSLFPAYQRPASHLTAIDRAGSRDVPSAHRRDTAHPDGLRAHWPLQGGHPCAAMVCTYWPQTAYEQGEQDIDGLATAVTPVHSAMELLQSGAKPLTSCMSLKITSRHRVLLHLLAS